MAHRDDQEAAHHRIVALERELEDARRRAERAEADAHAARAAHRNASEKKPRRSRTRTDEPRDESSSDPRWPSGALERYRRLVGSAALLQLPIAAALALDLGEDWFVGVALACVVAQVVATYVIGRAVRAPSPMNGAMVLLVAVGISIGAMMIGATTMFWAEVVPPGLGQLLVRSASGLAAVALGALVSARWASEAASSDVSSD